MDKSDGTDGKYILVLESTWWCDALDEGSEEEQRIKKDQHFWLKQWGRW